MGCFTAIILVLVGVLLIEIAIILGLNGRNKLLKTRVQYLQEKSRLLEKSIKDNQERFENDYTQLLNSQQLKPIQKDSWGQKEYEHYILKQQMSKSEDKNHISDEDWESLKVGDRVILKHRNTEVKVKKVNGKSIFISKRIFSCPFYYQYEVKEKVK